MDKIIDYIIFIGASLLIAFVKGVFNKNRYVKPKTVPQMQDFDEDFDEGVFVNDEVENVENNPVGQIFNGSRNERVGKENPIFSYENMDNNTFATEFKQNMKAGDEILRNLGENENNQNVQIDFNDEEMLKGIIYSEILNRKFF